MNIIYFDSLVSAFLSLFILFFIVVIHGHNIRAQKTYYLFFLYKIILTISSIFFTIKSPYGSDSDMYYQSTLAIINSDWETYFSFMGNFSFYNEGSEYLNAFGENAGYMSDISNSFVVRLGSLVAFIFNRSYIAICLFFTTFSFFGTWYLFVGFKTLFPENSKVLALSTLFMPTVAFWSSGFLKDPITFGCFGFLIYLFIRIYFQKIYKFKYLFYIIGFSFLLFIIKDYIFYVFLFSAFIIVVNGILKKRAKIFNIFFYSFLLVYFILNIDSVITRILEIAKTENSMQLYENIGTSGFVKLFEIDFSISGILKMIFASFTGVFYRPYLWESYNVFVFISAFESTVLMVFSLNLILKFKSTVQIISADNFLKFCLVFVVFFGFIIGLSTFNFGTISRYRIPAVPLLSLFLFVITFRNNRRIFLKGNGSRLVSKCK